MVNPAAAPTRRVVLDRAALDGGDRIRRLDEQSVALDPGAGTRTVAGDRGADDRKGGGVGAHRGTEYAAAHARRRVAADGPALDRGGAERVDAAAVHIRSDQRVVLDR